MGPGVPSAERGVLVGPGGCGKPPALPQRNGGFVGAKDISFGHWKERPPPHTHTGTLFTSHADSGRAEGEATPVQSVNDWQKG